MITVRIETDIGQSFECNYDSEIECWIGLSIISDLISSHGIDAVVNLVHGVRGETE